MSATRDDVRAVLASMLLAKTAVATFAIAPFLVGCLQESRSRMLRGTLRADR